MARYFGLVGLNGTLFFSIAQMEMHSGPPRPLVKSILLCLNPLLSLSWLPRTDDRLPLAVTAFVCGPFLWAGVVETILRRFVDPHPTE